MVFYIMALVLAMANEVQIIITFIRTLECVHYFWLIYGHGLWCTCFGQCIDFSLSAHVLANF